MGNNIKTYITDIIESTNRGFFDLRLFKSNLKGLQNYCDETGINFKILCNDYINRESSNNSAKEEFCGPKLSSKVIKRTAIKRKKFSL